MRHSILIGKRYKSFLENEIKKVDADVIWIADNPSLDNRLAGHADLSAINVAGKLILADYLADAPEIVKLLTISGFKNIYYSKTVQGCQYPNDVNLCACIVGDKLLHNTAFTDKLITKFFHGEYVHINQGYAKCMICVVDKRSIITSDPGVASVAADYGIDVLKISPGNIQLSGYDYGFIGGASISLYDRILFTGKLDKHPDQQKIYDFIYSKNKEVIVLTDRTVFDIGGGVVI